MPRKKKRRPYALLALVVLAVSPLLAFYFHKDLIRLGYRVYEEYYARNYPYQGSPGRVDVPGNYSIHGVDVSRWQSRVNWNRMTTLDLHGDTIKLTFAFIKATEGMFWEDPAFNTNWKNAGKAGITRGAYHYFKPNSNPATQARNFIGSVTLREGDLPPVVDVEESGRKNNKQLAASLRIFLTEVERHYHCKPIIYSNAKFIDRYLASDFSDYPFWVAHYYTSRPKLDSKVKWVFWQYHDRGRIAGCKVHVDLNVFKGNAEAFESLLISR